MLLIYKSHFSLVLEAHTFFYDYLELKESYYIWYSKFSKGSFNFLWEWGRVRCLFVFKSTKFHMTNDTVGNWSPNSRLLGNTKEVKLRIKGCLLLSCRTLLVLEMKWFNSIPLQNDVKIKLMGEQMETAVFYCNTGSLHILLLIYNENRNCKWQAGDSS